MAETDEKSVRYFGSELGRPSPPGVPFLRDGIGTRIGRAAELLGTRSSAYEVMGVSSATLQRYIAEETAPTFEAIARLCLAAGVRMHWIATADAPMRVGEKLVIDQLREPETPYRVASPTPGGAMDREMDLLTDAVRITEDVLHKFGIRQRATSAQVAELVRFVYGDLARGAAEDAASAALERILDFARAPR